MLMFFRSLFFLFFLAGFAIEAFSESAEPSSSNNGADAGSKQAIHLSFGLIQQRNAINDAYFKGEESKGQRIELSWYYHLNKISKGIKDSLVVGLDYIQMGVEEAYQDTDLKYSRNFSSMKIGWDFQGTAIYDIKFSIQPGTFIKLTDERYLKSKLGRRKFKLDEDRALLGFYYVFAVGYSFNNKIEAALEYTADWNTGRNYALGVKYAL
ncbi:MAG: hypothetical protein KBD78_08675 [Oligoflexales bacterium]|nr:hypothetical protein [Oligoflexales bacterium]